MILSKKTIVKYFYYIVIIELIIGGSGRVFELGSITLRMLLFAVSLIFSLDYYFNHKFNNKILMLILFFAIGITFGAFNGILSGSKSELIFEDIKPLLFFLLLPFFFIPIKNIDDVHKTSSILKRGALFLASLYIVILLLISLGKLDFGVFYELADSGDILFRGGQGFFFYKGFLYLGIGCIFYLSSFGKKNKLTSAFLFIILSLSLTRGFILMTAVVALFYIYIVNNKINSKIVFTFFLLVLLIYAFPILVELIGDRSDSDTIRVIQIRQVYERTTFLSIFFGHGFGQGVPIRPIHMENSFLEIFHKQGIIGLVFWIYILIDINFMYINLNDKKLKSLGIPYLLSCYFVYLQSLTNPFINNSIGMTIVLIAYVVMIRLNEHNHKNLIINKNLKTTYL